MKRLTSSVAIAVYNSERFLSQQLESMARQTRLPDEVVFCDNNSNDRTVEILYDWKSKVPFDVRIYRNEENIGCTRNFDRVLALPSKEIVIVADSDDIWKENRVERVMDIFEQNLEVGVLTSNAELVDGEGVFQNMLLDEYLRRMHIREFWSHFYPDGHTMKFWTGCTMSVRKSILDKILPVPANINCHDIWIYLLAPLFARAYYLDESLIQYRLHGSNFSTAPTVEHLRANPPRWRYFSTMIHTLGEHPDLLDTLIRRVETCDAPDLAKQKFARKLRNQKRHFQARERIERNVFSNLSTLLYEIISPTGYFAHPQRLCSIAYDVCRGLGVLR
ncbi:MAG: glycosyltransferase [Planctomycetia bacterium]|nr:glycosyltransferase [Planctomycetia bacterium]